MICKSRLKTVLFSAGLLSACVLLTGCDQDALKVGCPALRQYSRETLDRVSVELSQLPRDSVLRTFLKDYKSLRDACRTN